jgi:hypothetical protein
MARCETDIAYRVIVGEDIPDFRTISDFRKRHLTAPEGLFVEVLNLRWWRHRASRLVRGGVK